jgi:hypothetical protein
MRIACLSFTVIDGEHDDDDNILIPQQELGFCDVVTCLVFCTYAAAERMSAQVGSDLSGATLVDLCCSHSTHATMLK